MPIAGQKKFAALVVDLEAEGPLQPPWPNFSKLSKNEFHCHLSYKWVACWKNKDDSIIVEVYYAGSRQNAPY